MACAHSLIPVLQKGGVIWKNASFLAVFRSPVWPDTVYFTHTNLHKNNGQLYAVSELAGHQTSSESWATGRAVTPFPRVWSGGTHCSGQGAYGNICCGGHMFVLIKAWWCWHFRLNTVQKWFSVCSALAASRYSAGCVILLRKFLSLLWWLKIKLKATGRPRRLFCFWRNLRLGMISKRSVLLNERELAKAKWEAVSVSSTGNPASLTRTVKSSRPSETSLKWLCLV